MDKMKMLSPNLTQENIRRVRDLFPDCVTESRNESGNLNLLVDFDQLRQELSESIVEGPRERYHLDWPGKREALLTANAPIAKTLLPCREESVDFDTTKNLFVEGDNLDALKLLQETYLGKVKMIYIDPPYNTGNDFIYEDDFAENTAEYLKRSNQKDEHGNRLVANTEANGRFHSAWLSMMYPRLKLARNLLCDNGTIFISIDDNESDNLKKICNEIFGESNFIANAVWQKAYTSNMTAQYISNTHDHIMIYAKDYGSASFGRFSRTDEQKGKFKNSDNDPRGPWKAENLSAGKYYSAGQFEIIGPSGSHFSPPPGRYWRCNEGQYEKWLNEGRITFGKDGNGRPMLKKFLSEVEDGLTPNTWWEHEEFGSNKEASIELKRLFDGAAFFQTPKPVKLLKRICEMGADRDGIVLDFFAGSCTTAQAVLDLNSMDGGNRKFIMIQLPEPCDEGSEAWTAGLRSIADIGKERIRRAGKKILKSECHQGWNKDVGFRVLKIDSSNMADVHYTPDALDQGQINMFAYNIKPDRTPEDLLFQVLLDWGVDMSLPISKETIQGKTVFFVDENVLVACFDTGVNEELVKELARFEPLRVVFRDSGFVSDAVKINVEQVFKQISPSTEVKSI